MFEIKRQTGPFPVKRRFADALAEWGRLLGCNGGALMVPGSLSYRHGLGFVITREGADSNDLHDSDLLFVKSWNHQAGELTIYGDGDPPPETLWHAAVYQSRSGAIFVFFARSDRAAELAGRMALRVVTVTGGRDLDAVQAALGTGNILAIEGSGILSFGCTAEDAGRPLLTFGSH